MHVYNVLDSLCKHYDVIVLSPPVDEACPLYDQVVAWYPLPSYPTGLGDKVQNGLYLLRPRQAWHRAIEQILQHHKPSGVWFVYGHWGQYAPLIHQYGAFAVMMTQNVQSELTRQRATVTPFGFLSILTRLRAWAEAFHERTLFPRFDYVISLTEHDRCYHGQFVGNERSILIPGYLDEDKYQYTQHAVREENLLILTGSFDSFQNSQGALWFLGEIWPQIRRACPAVRIQLVGRGADQLPIADRVALGVETITDVPDVVPYLRRATIAVVPILHGSGIRYKILEALASEIPVVSTSLGAQGIAGKQGDCIMLADCADDFAEAVVALIQNPQQRHRLAQKGLALFHECYTTTVATAQIEAVVTRLLATQQVKVLAS